MKLNPVEKNAYDALAYLIQATGLPITAQSLKEQLFLHPDFPSLLSISDLLTDCKVENLATRIERKQLTDIPLPAIAYLSIYGGYFAPIRNITDKQVEWLDTNRGWQTDSLADFSLKWNQIVLLIEPNEESGEANYQQKKREELLRNARLPVVVTGLLLCLVCMSVLFLPKTVFHNGLLLSLLLTKLAGIVVTILLLWHTIGASNNLLRSLCSFASRNDCNSVLTSRAARLWGWLGWAEIGFAYFAGSFLALLMGLDTMQPTILSWLLVLNALALPYTVYSVYYQHAVAKSWCTLCLLVQALLWTEFALGIPHWQAATLTVDGQTVALFGLTFLLPVVLWMLMKRPLQEATQVFPLRRELQKSKFNPDYVESLFAQQPQMPPVFEGMRVVKMGNSQAEHTLTVVTNPLCGPCRRLHPDLEALVRNTASIKCQFVFIGSTASAPITQKLLSLATDDAERAMHSWYSHSYRDATEWSKKVDSIDKYSDAILQLDMHVRWCEMAQIMGTPTIYLNGRQLPLSYTLNDVNNLCRILRTASKSQELANSHKSVVQL